ncbi:MAG: OB-fold protein [Sphingomonadales bacterium]|jgi:hypothetical protein
MNMTIKYLQIFTLWAAALLSILLYFFAGNTLFGDAIIRALLGFDALFILNFTMVFNLFLFRSSKTTAFNLFRILGLLGGTGNFLIVFYAAFTVAGYWSEEINGILFVCSGVSFVFVLYSYLVTSFQSLVNQRQLQKPELTDWIFTLVVPVLLVLYGVFSLYNQETSTSSVGEPDFTIQPSVLMDAFEKDAAGANQKYIGKVVRFSGSVAEIGGDSSILITLNAWKEGYAVNCNFDLALKEKLSAVLEGDSLLIQCSCSGLSAPEEGMSLLSETSLEMTRCALVENYKNSPNLGTDVEHPNVAPKKKQK